MTACASPHGAAQGLCAVIILCVLPARPCAQHPSTGHADLDEYRASRIAICTDDFGELPATAKPTPRRKARAQRESSRVLRRLHHRLWQLDDYFPGKPYLNRGIGGQTTRRC